MNSPNSSNIIQNVKFSDSSEIFGYVQLDVLTEPLEGSCDREEWQETSRWIKYQEDLEKYSGRWSRPHIASISFNSLLQLKELIESDGIMVLNVNEYDLSAIVQTLCTELVDKGYLAGEDAGNLKSILLLKHKHVPATSEWNFSGLKKHQSSIENLRMLNFGESRRNSLPESVITHRISAQSADEQDIVQNSILKDEELPNKYELNKLLSPISEINGLRTICTKFSISENQSLISTLIMVGLKMPGIKKPLFVFLRISEPSNLPNITEFPIPVGVIVFIFTPFLTEDIENHTDFVELGRSFGCLMSNRAFFDRAQTARDKKQLLMGFKLFLKESLILTPPTIIDDFDENLLPSHILKTKMELIQWKYKRNSILSCERQNLVAFTMTPNVSFFTNSEKGIEGDINGGIDLCFDSVIEDPFTRTNRPFGGAINDLKRRFPHFKTDFTDSFNLQCIATIVFIYFAALSHVITFGALLGTKTNNMIGISETLVASFLSGTIFTLFSCQPLLPINPTGALLLFDELLYNYSVRHSLDFLTIRVWISLWAFGISCFVVCLEGSVYAKKFTRFTQEIFATFISLIFTFESLHSLMQIFEAHPLTPIKRTFERHNLLRNMSEASVISISEISDELEYQPNTALFSMFLMFGTFLLAYFLHEFKYSIFLGDKVRRILGDFGVPIAIVVMISIDYYNSVNTFTPKIQVPLGIQPSSPKLRGWFISPGGSIANKPFPIWLIFASAVPALLVFFLVFITLEICELLVNKKEFKMKKGSGLHWDLIVVSLVNVMNAFLGAPWVCVATLKALSHVSSLMVFSNTNAPGEKPTVIKVIEQRVTGLCVNLLIGCSILIAPLLRYIPIPVLLGVFLYMGITSFKITQLFARFKLLFIPSKNHPHNCNYVRNVKTSKMHLYTVLQVLVLVILWGIKSTKEISLGFPFFLMCLVPIRSQLARIFTQNELDALDAET